METAFQKNAFQNDAFQIEFIIHGTVITIENREFSEAYGRVVNPLQRKGGGVKWIPANQQQFVAGRVISVSAKQFSQIKGSVIYQQMVSGKITSTMSRSQSVISGYTDDSDEDILSLIMKMIED